MAKRNMQTKIRRRAGLSLGERHLFGMTNLQQFPHCCPNKLTRQTAFTSTWDTPSQRNYCVISVSLAKGAIRML